MDRAQDPGAPERVDTGRGEPTPAEGTAAAARAVPPEQRAVSGPVWRRRIERATELTVGFMGLARGAVAGAAGGGDAPLVGEWEQAAMGLALEGQRVALDVMEQAVAVSTRLTRVAMRVPGMQASANAFRQAAGPSRDHGASYRSAAIVEVRRQLPGYVSSITSGALDLVQIDDVLAKVDIDALISRVDVDGIISRVDVDGIISRVDIDSLLTRVDIDGLISRVDVESLIGRLDLDSLVGQTDLGAIIAQSTGGIASEGLDLVRRQGIGLDTFIERWAARVLPRRLSDAPPGPPLLVQGENGSAQHGSAQNGRAAEGSVSPGTISVEHGTVEHGTVEHGTVEHGTAAGARDHTGTGSGSNGTGEQ